MVEADEPLGGRIRKAKLEKLPYVLVVGDDDVAQLGDAGKFGAGFRADFGGDFGGALAVHVIDGGDFIAALFEAAGHVCSHATDADEADFFRHNR